jgi:peptide/nickel transport system permease protein
MTDIRPETGPTPPGRDRAARVESRRLPARWVRSLRRSPIAIAGFTIIGFFLLVVAFAPFIAPYSPTRQTLRSLYVPPGVGVSLRGPEGQFGLWVREVSRASTGEIAVGESQYPVRFFVRGERWSWFGGLVSSNLKLFGVDGPARFYVLGTDEQGRDVLSRIIHGAWISLSIGLITIGIGIAVGVPVGALSGYFAGTTDLMVQRIIDTMLAFPGILLAIVLVATFGTGLRNVMIAVGIASIPVYADWCAPAC